MVALYMMLSADGDFMLSGIPPNRNTNKSILKRLSLTLLTRAVSALDFLFICSICNTISLQLFIINVSLGYTKILACPVAPYSSERTFTMTAPLEPQD
jgi:hypothetical protein